MGNNEGTQKPARPGRKPPVDKPTQAPALAPPVEPPVEAAAQLAPPTAPVISLDRAPETPAPVPAPEPQPEPGQVEPLAEYAQRIEEAAQPLPVCQITHPQAVDGGLHMGKYAGIRLVLGDTVSALLSDGSTL